MSFLLNPYIYGGAGGGGGTPEANSAEFWAFGVPEVGIESLSATELPDMEYWAFGEPTKEVMQ